MKGALIILLAVVACVLVAADSQDVKAQSLEVFVTESAKLSAEDAATEKATFPKGFANKVSAAATNHVHFRIKLTGSLVPAQVFIQLMEAGSKRAAVFVASSSSQGVFSLKINVGSSEFLESVFGPGAYSVSLLVGDASLANSIVWKLGELNLDIPAAAQVEKDELAVKPEIAHQFRAAEDRPASIIALIFTGICVSPFALLLLSLMRTGVTLALPSHPVEYLYGMVFQGSIGSILALYFFYWCGLSIFQAMAGLSLLCVVALVSGSKALRAKHLRCSKVKGA